MKKNNAEVMMRALRLLIMVSIMACSVCTQAYAQEAKSDEQWKTSVDFGESVDRSEAIAIAKDFLTHEERLSEYHKTKYLTKLLNGVWHVIFLKKLDEYMIGQAQSIRIQIDEQTGEVISADDQAGFYIERRLE